VSFVFFVANVFRGLRGSQPPTHSDHPTGCA
jgi:hypothetical protein